MHYAIKDVVATVAVVLLSARSSNESPTEIFKEVGAAEVANF